MNELEISFKENQSEGSDERENEEVLKEEQTVEFVEKKEEEDFIPDDSEMYLPKWCCDEEQKEKEESWILKMDEKIRSIKQEMREEQKEPKKTLDDEQVKELKRMLDENCQALKKIAAWKMREKVERLHNLNPKHGDHIQPVFTFLDSSDGLINHVIKGENGKILMKVIRRSTEIANLIFFDENETITSGIALGGPPNSFFIQANNL